MASAEGKEEAEMSGAASLLFLAEIIANGFTPNSPYATMAANGPAAPLPQGSTVIVYNLGPDEATVKLVDCDTSAPVQVERLVRAWTWVGLPADCGHIRVRSEGTARIILSGGDGMPLPDQRQ
jgi:hypothetical protein